MDFDNITFYDSKDEPLKLKEGYEVKFRPTCVGVVRNSEGKYLFIVDERSNGQWEFPGGGLDINETLAQGVIREVKEETGYDIKLVEEYPIYSSQAFIYSDRKDNFDNKLCFFFLAELASEERGEQNTDDGEEILEVEWLDKESIKNMKTISTQEEFLEYFKENIL